MNFICVSITQTGSGQIQLWQFLLELLSDSSNAGKKHNYFKHHLSLSLLLTLSLQPHFQTIAIICSLSFHIYQNIKRKTNQRNSSKLDKIAEIEMKKENAQKLWNGGQIIGFIIWLYILDERERERNGQHDIFPNEKFNQNRRTNWPC